MRFFHDSAFSLELQDALFNLDYIAHNVGQTVDAAASGALTEETVVATGSGALTVTGTPASFLGQGNVGWIALPGSDSWTTFTFTSGASATNVKVGSDLITQGDSYCVKYINDVACEEVTVSADIIPDEVTVVLRGDLYKASKGNDVSTSSVIGHIEVEVPRFQLNGSMDISLNSSGAAQIPFAGSALVTEDTTCEGGGYYAKIRRIDANAQWYDNLVAFALEGSDTITVAASGTKALNVYGVFANGSSKLIDPARLAYTVTGSVGTVDATTGIFTAGSSAGTGTITVAVKGSPNPKPAVGLVVGVTVTSA